MPPHYFDTGLAYDVPETPAMLDAPTSTFALLEKARAGDAASLSEAFEKHRRRLAVLIYYKLGGGTRDFAQVEDLVQETCLRAFRDLNSFTYRSPGSFFRWLASIADHAVIDRVRYQGRERRAGEEIRFRSPTNPAGPEPADTCTPSRVFAQHQAVERLTARLDLLPPDYREALVLSRIEGLTTAEIATRMRKSREAVALLVYRAVKRLRTLAKETGV
jgi:RNA polymerase sigma-70 factor (ECF subfamily)